MPSPFIADIAPGNDIVLGGSNAANASLFQSLNPSNVTAETTSQNSEFVYFDQVATDTRTGIDIAMS
jgi:hypothetical protein